MLLDNIPPSSVLSEYISKYRIADFVFSDQKPTYFKAYPPRPQECLHFYPRDTETVKYEGSKIILSGKRSVITGQHTVTNYRYVGKDFIVFQVVFQPGILFRITGISAKEIVNCYLDAEEILGKEVRLVNEQLYQAANYPEMISIVEKYLISLVHKIKKKDHKVDKIAELMIQNKYHSLGWFADRAYLSYRQFDRMFKERIGINPKLFKRIINFDYAFRMRNKHPDKDWLTIAIECEYYDYQHLAKTYKEFTGLSPVNFSNIEKQAPERLFGDIEI